MELRYITQEGDTFDMIALDFYNNENKANIIVLANPQYCNILVFSSGIELVIPIIEQSSAESLPPWKR